MNKELEIIKKTLEKNCCLADLEEEFKIIETALKELNDYKKVFEKLNLDISDAVDLENWIKLAQFHYENKNKKLKALEITKEIRRLVINNYLINKHNIAYAGKWETDTDGYTYKKTYHMNIAFVGLEDCLHIKTYDKQEFDKWWEALL